MSDKQFLQFNIKAVKDGELTIVASDETLDRMGEVIPLESWDLKNYKKNPVLLVDHEYVVGNIVGRAKNLKIGDKQMTFTPEFHGLTQLSQEVEKMVKSDFAPAVSVGFLPHGPAKDGDKGSNELLEISFVAVPANPNALALAMKAFKPEQESEIKSWLQKATPTAADLIKTIDPLVDQAETAITAISDALDAAGEVDDGDESKAVLKDKLKILQTELAEVKEGRVLSGKNRELIANCSTALKAAVSLLEDLLAASEPNKGKENAEHKGRDTKVEHGKGAPNNKARLSVVRALQDINKNSNFLLSELKG